MTSALPRPVPTPPREPERPIGGPTTAPGQRPRVSDAWAEHIRQMDPDDLRMLALSMPVIEQAKGILMNHFGCPATTAFTILQRWSASHDLKLRDLAAQLVDEASRVDDAGDEPRLTAVERVFGSRRTA